MAQLLLRHTAATKVKLTKLKNLKKITHISRNRG